MVRNPYSGLPKSAFWKTGVAQENPYSIEGIYKKKFDIAPDAKIATAGSCFAQHISRHLKKNGYNVLDLEPAPPGLPENLHQKFGFSMYSARYGNIYTARQLLQLAKEAAGKWTPQDFIWEKGGKYFDALRPAVEPEGLDSQEEVLKHRQFHIRKVEQVFKELDVFVFTLGLTEMWIHKESGTVYPTAPGTLAGEFDDNIYGFKNTNYNEIISDFKEFKEIVRELRAGKKFKILLTVSPVPLTATSSGNHILVSNTFSKSVLRNVAGCLSEGHNTDYFPSYEIVLNPRNHSSTYSENLRTVRGEAVETVMKHFFAQHAAIEKQNVSSRFKRKSKKRRPNIAEDVQCEEVLMEAFQK